ncbi:Mitochondrial import inner membrane translocase subunit Tim9 B [Melipona quadrifasciata]|uniref:Mitochondrial import inner membrane translocase subunit Tim9 B n=1 Tax=Melipona quadrifasciata TaxID=166423 RepID=A0A0N0BK27_9HYME|nr:Mitochondrial import inner membrane translocase subunit Tim9 B [Melipona quadrifasciata]
MKDFQLLFNQMSELQCVENCSGKHIHANHKIMEVFMEVQPVIARRSMEEYQKQMKALEETQEEQNNENTR